MPYLIIIALVAATGVTRLYLQHRRQTLRAQEVDGFLDSLEAISSRSRASRTERRERTARPRPRPAPVAHRRNLSLDADRRAAARRRIEQRRKARTRLAG